MALTCFVAAVGTVPDELLTVAAVAARLGFSEFAIRGAIRRGELEASKLLGQYRVSEDAVAAFVSAGAVAPKAPIARRRPVVAVTPSRQYPVAGSFRAMRRAKEGK